MDLISAAEAPCDRLARARQRLDAVIATCRPAQRPGSLDEQEQLSRVLLDLLATIRTSDPMVVFDVVTILADAPWAPEGACGALARAEIEAAARSNVRHPKLEATRLRRLVARSSTGFRRDIAGCGPLPSDVVRALAEDRDVSVVVALLGNDAIGLVVDSIDALVARARSEPGLRSALARRPELDPEQALRLAASLSVDGRRRLAARFGSDMSRTVRRDEVDPDDEAEWVRKLDARGDLLPSSLLFMLRRGWSIGFCEGLRRLGEPTGESARTSASTEWLLLNAGVDGAALEAFRAPSAANPMCELETTR